MKTQELKDGDRFIYPRSRMVYTLHKLSSVDLWVLLGTIEGNNDYVAQWSIINDDSTTPLGAFGGCFEMFEKI